MKFDKSLAEIPPAMVKLLQSSRRSALVHKSRCRLLAA